MSTTQTTTPSPQALLREAAQTIERALAQLDTSGVECPGGCHTFRFNNFQHAKTWQRFKDTPEKLRDEARFLEQKESNAAVSR